tara:strand:+ start:977 stop:1762 length:786 start_codon:yes stop_codon:yes gene_type:complete
VLNPDAVERAANLLMQARLNHDTLDGLPDACRPTNLQEAYAVQDKLIELLGWPLAGWFCACTNKTIQTLLGLDEPYYARLLKDFVLDSPATLEASKFPPIVLECEFGFRLAHDLPSREQTWSREEVEAAIASVHPTIEVVAGHLMDWPNQDVFSVIADNGTDGALIVGPGESDWRALDLVSMEVSLEVDGQVVREGTGNRVLGDPVSALVWLANARSRDGDGLKAGHVHNTGTATDIYWMQPGEHAAADFCELGTVAMTLR